MSSRRTTALAATLLAGLVGLAGCSGDGSDEPGSAGSSGGSTSAEAAPYLPVPEGVTLTAPGSRLDLGERAVLAWEPRQDLVGVLDVNVTRIERTTVKKTLSAWRLSEAQAASTPYFVRVRVKNVGDTDLGGRRVPLYGVSDQNVLLESTPFASSFEPCPSTPLPKKFPPNASTRTCLVYFAPDRGTLEAVSFRPEESFDPIIWTGDVEPYKPRKTGR